jgi:hypothetical protein
MGRAWDILTGILGLKRDDNDWPMPNELDKGVQFVNKNVLRRWLQARESGWFSHEPSTCVLATYLKDTGVLKRPSVWPANHEDWRVTEWTSHGSIEYRLPEQVSQFLNRYEQLPGDIATPKQVLEVLDA